MGSGRCDPSMAVIRASGFGKGGSATLLAVDEEGESGMLRRAHRVENGGEEKISEETLDRPSFQTERSLRRERVEVGVREKVKG